MFPKSLSCCRFVNKALSLRLRFKGALLPKSAYPLRALSKATAKPNPCSSTANNDETSKFLKGHALAGPCMSCPDYQPTLPSVTTPVDFDLLSSVAYRLQRASTRNTTPFILTVLELFRKPKSRASEQSFVTNREHRIARNPVPCSPPVRPRSAGTLRIYSLLPNRQENQLG